LVLCLAFVASTAASAPAEEPAALPDANEFIKGLAENQRRREQIINDYTYDVNEVEERLDMEFAPRPGKRDLEADKVLRHLAGRIWVDERSVRSSAPRSTTRPASSSASACSRRFRRWT